MAKPEKIRLGEVLIQQNLLTEDQLKQALAEQKSSGRKLGRIFIENGFVTEEGIAEAIARQLQIPFINLKFYNTNSELINKLPETQARRFRALVLEDRGATLLLGMADPSDLFAYDELARLLTFSNVLITAHQAFLTREALGDIARTTLANLTAFAGKQPLVEGSVLT